MRAPDFAARSNGRLISSSEAQTGQPCSLSAVGDACVYSEKALGVKKVSDFLHEFLLQGAKRKAGV